MPKQSGLRPGDSCSNQLQSIALEILSAFDDGREVRDVFLDISKAFDRVWLKGLLFRLQQSGISGELNHIITYSLSCTKQSFVKRSTFVMDKCESGCFPRVNS